MHAQYGLDIAQYISLPGFAYNAFLKQTGVELHYPYDRELYELIQNNIHSGFISTVKQRVTVNNKHIDHNFKGISKYLLYLDFNSLYASVMTQPLPLGGFQKLTEDERDKFIKQGLESFDCRGDTGNWLFIDTKPISPQDAQRTDKLLLTLKKRNIDEGKLSDYCHNILESEGGKFMKNSKKLVGTLYAKKDYPWYSCI